MAARTGPALLGVLLILLLLEPAGAAATRLLAQRQAAASGDVTVKRIAVKINLDLHVPHQNPLYTLSTENGHYLLWDFQNGLLVYDGQTIYAGSDVLGSSLSHNGLHYTYLIGPAGQNQGVALYVDGQKRATGVDLEDPKVTDDGQHYFYVADGRADIREDQNVVARADHVTGYLVSGDGASILVEQYNQTSYFSLFYNGMPVYDAGLELYRYFLSNDGQHYAYEQDLATSDQPPRYVDRIVVDGSIKPDQPPGGPRRSLVLTDDGQYLYTSQAGDSTEVYLNDRLYTSLSEPPSLLLANEDASHILVCGSTTCQLDLQPFSLPPDEFLRPDAPPPELRGNTLYIYEVTGDF